MKTRIIIITLICVSLYNSLTAQIIGTYNVEEICVLKNDNTDSIINNYNISFTKLDKEPTKLVTYNLWRPFAIIAEMISDSSFIILDQCFESLYKEEHCFGNKKVGSIKNDYIDFSYWHGDKRKIIYCQVSGVKISDSVSIPKPQIIEPKGEVVNIYDSMGRQICGKSIESLPAGMYIFQYENGVTEKIVKQ